MPIYGLIGWYGHGKGMGMPHALDTELGGVYHDAVDVVGYLRGLGESGNGVVEGSFEVGVVKGEEGVGGVLKGAELVGEVNEH